MKAAIALVFALSSIVLIEPAPFDILILLLIGISFLSSHIQVPRQIGVPLVLLWVFLLQNLISMYFVEDVQQGVKFLLITIYLLVLWFFLAGLVTRFQESALNSLFAGYTAAAILSAITGFVTYFRLLPFSETLMTAGRIQGFFKDPNVFGPFLVPVALYAVLKLEEPGAARKGWWATVWVTLSVAIFLSYSRAAWINYAFSLLVVFLYAVWHVRSSKEAVRKSIAFGLVSLLFLALFAYLLDVPAISEMFSERFQLQEYDQDRFAAQRIAYASVLDNALGIGPGQSEVVFDYSTHSLYARVLAENGIVGFLAFLLFLAITTVRAMRLACRKSPHSRIFIVCAAALLGILVNSLVVDTLHWRHFWVLLAIPWGNYRQHHGKEG